MAKKMKPGRPINPDRKKVNYVYLRDSQKKVILKKHKNLTEAILVAAL